MGRLTSNEPTTQAGRALLYLTPINGYTIASLERDIAAIEREARAPLVEWVKGSDHRWNCGLSGSGLYIGPDEPCTCGRDALLAEYDK